MHTHRAVVHVCPFLEFSRFTFFNSCKESITADKELVFMSSCYLINIFNVISEKKRLSLCDLFEHVIFVFATYLATCVYQEFKVYFFQADSMIIIILYDFLLESSDIYIFSFLCASLCLFQRKNISVK